MLYYIMLYIDLCFVSLVPDAIPRNIQGLGSGVFRNNMEISWEVMH